MITDLPTFPGQRSRRGTRERDNRAAGKMASRSTGLLAGSARLISGG